VPDAAASACSSRRGTAGAASYSMTTDWLGVPYVIEGAFISAGPRVMQLEILATPQRSALARALLAVWVKRAGE